MYYRSVTDEDGFRNNSPINVSDIVVLGDSFAEVGHDEYDTFSKRLEVISGYKTKNLGLGWYGPFQYLLVFERYGLKQEPKYAVFCFFEGNDIGDIHEYLKWKEGGDYWHFNLARKHFFQRFAVALGDLVSLNPRDQTTALTEQKCIRDCPNKKATDVHPDLVVLEIRGNTRKTVFFYKSEPRSPDVLLQTIEYNALKEILQQFKAVSSLNRVIPIVVFIPSTVHIYAQYSVLSSGARWMKIRDAQISSKTNTETAVMRLLEQVGIRTISLTSSFEEAANKGRFLYYDFDTHWNSEGREIAASYVAAKLAAFSENREGPANARP